MIPVVKVKMDEKQVISMASVVPLDAWSADKNFTFLKAYRASVSDADKVFVIKVTKEDRNGEESAASKPAYGLSVYKQHIYANGDVEDIFAGGVSNSDQAMRIFRAIDLRDLRREIFI